MHCPHEKNGNWQLNFNKYIYSQDSSGQDQDRLSLEGQGQDSSQETLVAMHVHVLPPRVQTHGAAHL